MLFDPTARETDVEGTPLGTEHDLRQGSSAASSMQQYCYAQHHDQQLSLDVPGWIQLLQGLEAHLASMRSNDAGQYLLFFLRKSRHVRVFQQISAVLVIVRM